MFIPYSCNAPIYYRPYGTVGLIVVNTAIYFAHAFDLIPQEPWVLAYGDGLHPLQWLLCNFAHGNFWHLAGNMIFLWVFGLVVEGKLGAVRFLSCYLAIGLGHALIEQAIMLGYSGPTEGSLGASAAIFGILAMACVWAPANDVTVWVWLMWMIHFSFDISVGMFAALYIGMEVAFIAFHAALASAVGADASSAFATSSWLHLLGALLGAPLAIVMLKRGVVDCEDWDLFSVLSGNYGPYAKEAREKVAIPEEKLAAKREQKTLEETRRFEAFLAIGQPLQALAVRRRMLDLGAPLPLSAGQLAALVVGLHKDKKWAESAPVMAEYIAAYGALADPMRVKLAQICVMELDRPRKALELLAAVKQADLAPPQRELFRRIAVAARQKAHAGEIEVDDGQW